jgi:hypothetical protein
MKTGQPAYDAGMRGGEKPQPKPKTPATTGKQPIKRISIEKADTGHIVDVEREPKPVTMAKNGSAPSVDYNESHERHAHQTADTAKAHVNALIDEMGSKQPAKGPAKQPQNAEDVSVH